MTGQTMTIQREDPLILSERLAKYFQPYPAKVLARTIDCTESTAENFRLARSWPSARHWRLIVQAFGRDVLAAVFDPEINDTLARLHREERQLQERLDEIKTRRRKAAGLVDSDEERRSPPLDRTSLDRDLFDEARP
jgi:hypothetical protein